MTTTLKILCLFSLTAAVACSTSDNSTGTTGTTGGAGTTTGGSATTGGAIPTAPTLGSEIDRMGRGAVNTALTAPLGSYTLADGGTISTNQAKDLYNLTSDPTEWAQFIPAFVGNLAIFDALDGTCGNQLVAGKPDGGPAGVYGTLATVLVDDQLYVDTAVTACTQYLAVELEAVGILSSPTPKDCGGRTPTEDIIDETYSALAVGGLSGVTDGVASKAGGTAQNTTFPFLGAAQ